MAEIRSFPIGDPLATALGYASWNFHPGAANTSTTMTSQQSNANAIWLPFGIPVNGIALNVGTAGAGTTPAHFYVGLCSPTVMVAQSNNLNASASLTATKIQQFAFNASYTPTKADSPTGLFYVVTLEDGAFGTTAVKFFQGGSAGMANLTGFLSPAYNIGTAQTALPSNGAAVTLTLTPQQTFQVGVY